MRTTRGRVLSGALVSTVIAALLVVGPAAVAPTQASETPSNLGTDFWIAIPGNSGSSQKFELHAVGVSQFDATVWSPVSTTQQIAMDDPGVVQQSDEVGLLRRVVTTPAPLTSLGEVISYSALRLTSTVPAAVQLVATSSLSAGGLVAVPTQVAGTEFRLVSMPASGGTGRLIVISLFDGNEIAVTPNQKVGTRPSGLTYVTSLNAGQVYSATSSDWAGTLVTSTQPILVVVGYGCGYTDDFGACDQMMSAIPPVSAWGSEFHLLRHQNSSVDTRAESIRVVAHESDTVVSVDGQVSATLAAGQSYHTTMFADAGEASVITSTKPVLLAHFMNEGEYFEGALDFARGGPEMAIVTPTRQYLSSYLFAVPTGFDVNRVRMAVPTAAVTSLHLDGQPVATESATVIPGTDHSSLDVMVTSGRHVLSAAAPFGAYAYGAAYDSSYGFPAGFGLAPQPTSPDVTEDPGVDAGGEGTSEPEPSVEPTDPPASDPSATETPAPDPSASEPPASDPTETPAPTPDPSASEPSPTDPPTNEPLPSDPPATDPPATDPPETDPPVTPPSDHEPLMDPPSESVTPEPQASTEPQPDPVATPTPTPTPTPTLTPAPQPDAPAAGAPPPAAVAAPAPVQSVPVPTPSASSAATTVETSTALVSDTVTVGNSLESATANALSPASPTATPLPLAPTGIAASTSQVLAAVTMRQNVRGFAAARTTLTASQRRAVIAMAKRVPVRSTVTCTGYSGTGPDKTALRLVGLARAQAVCAVVKKQRPGLITVLRYGGARSASTAAEQARNRKVVVSVRQRA